MIYSVEIIEEKLIEAFLICYEIYRFLSILCEINKVQYISV